MKNKDKFDVALGQLLREQRKKKRMSMADAGKMLGITSQMVSLYELGYSPLTVSMLKKFCDVYCVKYYDLIKEAGELEEVS